VLTSDAAGYGDVYLADGLDSGFGSGLKAQHNKKGRTSMRF